MSYSKPIPIIDSTARTAAANPQQSLPTRESGAGETLTTADFFVLVNSSTQTYVLPTITTHHMIVIKNASGVTNTTIQPGFGSIDGGGQITMTDALSCVTLMAIGSNWFIVSRQGS